MNNKPAIVAILAVVAIMASTNVTEALLLEQLAIYAGNLLAILWEYSGITGAQCLWIAVSALCLWFWGAQK